MSSEAIEIVSEGTLAVGQGAEFARNPAETVAGCCYRQGGHSHYALGALYTPETQDRTARCYERRNMDCRRFR